MKCSEFRVLLVDLLANELNNVDTAACLSHERECHECQVLARGLRRTQSVLLDGWPMEELNAPPSNFVALHARSVVERMAVWSGAASAALIVALLVTVAAIRPQVNWQDGELRVAIQHDKTQVVQTTPSIDKEMVRDIVATAVRNEVASQMKAAAGSAPKLNASDEKVQRIGTKVDLIEESQRQIWRELQQEHLFVESVWRRSNQNFQPAAYTNPIRP